MRDPLVILERLIDDLENIEQLAAEGLASPAIHPGELLSELREARDGVARLLTVAMNLEHAAAGLAMVAAN